MKIEAKLDRTAIAHDNPGLVHAMVSITAPAVEESRRNPMDLCLVLDVSGSMAEAATTGDGSPSKLALVQEAAQRLVDNLLSTDRVGLVVFSDDAQQLAHVAPLDEAHRRRIAEQIHMLQPTASTNLYGGAEVGIASLAEVADDGDENRTRRVLLFTDGHANVGIFEQGAVIAALSARVQTGKATVSISMFGFGTGREYNPELLTSIARVADGNAYHCEGADGILTAFADELGALRAVAASDVRIRLTPGADVQILEVLNDCTVHTADGVTTVEVGALYGDETQHVVIALAVPQREKVFPRPTTALHAVVTGVTVTGALIEEKHAIEFRYVGATDATLTPDPAVEEQRLRLRAGQAITRAYEKAAAGDHIGAAAKLRRHRDRLLALGTDGARMLAGILEAIANDVGDPTKFRLQAMHVQSAASSVVRQRSSGSSYTDDGYKTKSQQRARQNMGAQPVASPVSASPPPQAGAASVPIPAPSNAADKRSSRRW